MAIFNSYVKLPEGRTILLSDLQFIKALPHIGDIPTIGPIVQAYSNKCLEVAAQTCFFHSLDWFKGKQETHGFYHQI